MKSQELNEPSSRMFFLALAAVGLLLSAGCSSSNSSAPAAAPSGDPQAATVFGDEIALTGYGIQSNNAGHTEIELRWKAVRKPAADYLVFVHALDSSGGIAFQADHPLKNTAGLPPTSWSAGEAVTDRFPIVPSPGHASGTYPLRIGLYTASPMKLLQVTQPGLPSPTDAWKSQSILLAQVECK
jgi:hypothetical protein